jgi:hypothetical protein
MRSIEFNLKNFSFNLGLSISISIFFFHISQRWIDEGTHGPLIRWILPSMVLSLTIMLYLYIYFLMSSKTYNIAQSDTDPYRRFADGVLSYAEILYKEKRDPALLRLRNNSSLTLHVLGFHHERIQLGHWALEAAQYVDDRIAIMSILIDDLGWAKYLVNDMACTENIKRAIDYGATFPPEAEEPTKSFLIAKAQRHLGVIYSTINRKYEDKYFTLAEQTLLHVSDLARDACANDLAHIKYARALAVASSLGVNVEGQVRVNDRIARENLGSALNMARTAKEEFKKLGDQGRYAKSMVLELRILEAIDNPNEVELLKPLCERAVSASVWARPQGRTFITGK